MTTRTEHKLGLTNVFKRVAFHMLLKGLGTHKSPLPSYDKVVVRELYDFVSPSGDDSVPSQGGIVVEFYANGRREKWIDFGIRTTGGGGAPILTEV